MYKTSTRTESSRYNGKPSRRLPGGCPVHPAPSPSSAKPAVILPDHIDAPAGQTLPANLAGPRESVPFQWCGRVLRWAFAARIVSLGPAGALLPLWERELLVLLPACFLLLQNAVWMRL